jgi:ketosteroid isomerase-like protein
MKHSFVKFFGVVILAALFSSCNNEAAKTETAGFSLDSAKASITASNKVYGACFASGDSTAFANCYTSDGCISPAGAPKMCGTQAITAFFNGGRKMGISNVVLTTEEVMGGKDALVETGKYELFVGDKVSAEKGKYIVVWKEENGKWKMHRDIWNSDAPPPPAGKQEASNDVKPQ